MQKIFISSFCVLFEDYDLLEQLCKSCPEVPMGAELGTSWPIPNFDELLDSQVPRFASGPVTSARSCRSGRSRPSAAPLPRRRPRVCT